MRPADEVTVTLTKQDVAEIMQALAFAREAVERYTYNEHNAAANYAMKQQRLSEIAHARAAMRGGQ